MLAIVFRLWDIKSFVREAKNYYAGDPAIQEWIANEREDLKGVLDSSENVR